MKGLLILRHAKSSWDDEELDDHERPLSKRGKQDAPLMGLLLRDQGLLPDLILCSSAKRAHRTAKLVAEASAYGGEIWVKQELYAAPASIYLEAIRALPDTSQRVLVIGHNPGLEELVKVLTGETITLATAALAYMNLPIDGWLDLDGDTRAELVTVWKPKQFK